MRALGAPRAHVLHARALSRHAALPHSTRPVPGPYCITEPRTSPLPAPRHLWRLQRRWQRPLGSTPTSAADSAADGAAQAARARQLPQRTARAYPRARRHAFVAAMMPCNYRKVVAGDRRSPATVRAQRKEGEGDQSNLTSGPSEPTVSDPLPRSLWLSGSAKTGVRLPCFENVFPSNRFPFQVLFKNRI